MIYHLGKLRGTGEELQTKNTWPKFNMKTARSSTTTWNPFQMRIKKCKTKSLKGLLQEVHVLLAVQFEISSARHPTFNYMLKTKQKLMLFLPFLILLKRQRISNDCVDEKVAPIHKLSNGILYSIFR